MTSDSTHVRSPGISYQELLDTDTHAVPAVLRVEAPKYLGDDDIPVERYVSREWHEKEVQNLWSRVWQYACREDEIPEVGDFYVYEIVRSSYIVIRTAPDTIQAYPNACLHRGRRLKDYDGRCSEIRCPYHGFAWTVEGELKDVPADWDFPQIEEDSFSLPRCAVGTWAGFVFINPDPDAEPLYDFLGEIVDHFEIWDLANRYTEIHLARIIHANWKIAQEAFCESYHVNATHPQILPFLGDTNSQVDIWENFSRMITPGGTPSPNLDWQPTEEEIIRAVMDTRVGEETAVSIGDDQTARAVAAAGSRERWRPGAGEWVDQLSDAEMMDNLDYTVFPNFHPWGALNRLVYRFRPNGDDHRSSIMEVIFLSPYSGKKPEPSPIQWLNDDQPFTDVLELGMLAKVFEQDVFNMAKVQIGLEATRKPGVTMSIYQESKIRWLHQKLAEWVEV